MTRSRGFAGLIVCAFIGCGPEPTNKPARAPALPVVATAELQALEASGVETIYTPIYSHINTGSGGTEFNLAVTLAVRNIEPKSSVILKSVDYYDTAGKRLRGWLDRPVRLGPMATYSVFVREDDVSGGIGANVRLEWIADGGANPPLVEAVHASTASGQGVSFITRGIAVERPAVEGEKR